eukprot:15233167-Ditylum_brightwellii.AAC.1
MSRNSVVKLVETKRHGCAVERRWWASGVLTERLLSTERTALLTNMLVFAGFCGQHAEEYFDGEMVAADE